MTAFLEVLTKNWTVLSFDVGDARGSRLTDKSQVCDTVFWKISVLS